MHRDRPLPVGRDQAFDDGYTFRRQGSSRYSSKKYRGNRQGYLYGKNPDPNPVRSRPHSGTGRRVLSELQPDKPVYHLSDVEFGRSTPRSHNRPSVDFHTDPKDRFQTGKAPNIRKDLKHTYDRLKERRKKLRALRYGLELDMDYSDAASLQSETTDYGDRRSLISANSYTQGLYRCCIKFDLSCVCQLKLIDAIISIN